MAPGASAPPAVTDAYGDTTTALIAVIATAQHPVAQLDTVLAERFEQHSGAVVYGSMPGLARGRMR